MKSNAFRTALIVAAALSVVSTAAEAKWWKFGKSQDVQTTQTTPVAQSTPGTTVTPQAAPTYQATPVNYNQQLTKAQYKELAYQQRQQHHKLKIHLPFFYMGAF